MGIADPKAKSKRSRPFLIVRLIVATLLYLIAIAVFSPKTVVHELGGVAFYLGLPAIPLMLIILGAFVYQLVEEIGWVLLILLLAMLLFT